MSAEKVPIQDHLDTSVTASLEDQHLIWMSVVTSLPLLCHASETFGQACVVMSMRMRLSTSHIFLVAVTVRLFVKTTKDVNSSVMRWITKVTTESAGSITTATALSTMSARTA